MAGMYDASITHHKDASAPRMNKDENDVHKALHTIESWVNPFKSRNATEPLVNIASAVKAADSITDDLRTAEKKGNAAFLVKSMTVKSSATAVIVKADRGWFTRMVVIAHRRQMNMQ